MIDYKHPATGELMNSLNDEQRERLEQIRVRQARCMRSDRDDVPQEPHVRAYYKELRQAEIDRGFLLSLVDSKAAEGAKDSEWALRELADGWISNNEREGDFGFYRNAQRVLDAIANDAATQMRDKCVEAVIDYFGGLTSTQVNRDDLVAALKSLTLDPKQ